jgi:very-short-patch-repair endonuclease
VFTSLTAEDIDLERASGRGVRSLKAFLQFARTGRLPTKEQERSAAELPLEDSIRAALLKEGFDVHPQVGVAGFFIDLAVVDRDQSDRYVVGLECDGESYGASRSARDRDRLRQAVLEDHGWILHRVWSTDWFHHPGIQLKRIREVIEQAHTASRERNGRPAEAPPTTAPEILRESAVEYRAEPSLLVAEPYVMAEGVASKGREPQEMSAAEMAEVLAPIIEVEGPIHEEELVVRIKERWGFQRVGTRIQESVLRGVRFLVEANRCLLEDHCAYLPEQTGRVRNRENAPASGVRKPDLLPPVEVRAAIVALIESAHGAGRRELPTAVARLLGFKTTTSQFRSLVERQIQVLEEAGQIAESKGLLQRAGNS